MSFNETLASRVRQTLTQRKRLTEKKMFGGLSFLLKGNMCCGILGDNLILRLGPENAEAALREPHTKIFDFTGKPMKGWVVVTPTGCESEEALAAWVEKAVAFAAKLPAK